MAICHRLDGAGPDRPRGSYRSTEERPGARDLTCPKANRSLRAAPERSNKAGGCSGLVLERSRLVSEPRADASNGGIPSLSACVRSALSSREEEEEVVGVGVALDGLGKIPSACATPIIVSARRAELVGPREGRRRASSPNYVADRWAQRNDAVGSLVGLVPRPSDRLPLPPVVCVCGRGFLARSTRHSPRRGRAVALRGGLVPDSDSITWWIWLVFRFVFFSAKPTYPVPRRQRPGRARSAPDTRFSLFSAENFA